ncbi:carbohydrate ABC transporter permease [Rudaeicoccus suwonensis]|uniref:Carbohydrate ABC transporter membrane protein 2 (CUT1 family) n=1 Tax=Rudaeicoccus suwonensis TaxID=657409 RepID=A0A561E7C5_9MICO|nr:carbohydrate ABC transporter permease [Rudaeicoccus suwonensis]TWE11511.1 carbohydrate ABC transporter membrane protein 2 (CUT1 family) [Rudaeicoccus suwonensis]
MSTHAATRTGKKARDYVLMTAAAIVMFAPIYYLLIGSLKPSNKVLNGFAGFIPTDLSFHNYSAVFSALDSGATGYFGQFFINSFLISLVIVLGGLLVNSMAGYAFARLDWRGRDKLFLVVVLLSIVPFESVAVPLMQLMSSYRDSLIGQMLPFIVNPFSVYLFYTFFLDIPKSMEEAARLDGLGPVGTFFRIIVPNSKPAFATVAILTFLTSWGQFLWPSLMTSNPAVRPLPLEIGVFSAQTPPNWGQIFAFGTLLVLPVLVMFLVFQRWFVQSVAGSAIKG